MGECTLTPTVMNLGSGKNYMNDVLNVDIDARWKPDFVWDAQSPLYISDTGQECSPFPLGTFDKIIAYDVLEHLPNLVTAMSNCLALLKEGGIMDILVPYDLSYGAWQDPTHVRAFNERSWAYYWEWAWYLGWQEFGLKLTKLEYVVALGIDPNTPIPELVKTPRAIDSMKVILAKMRLPNAK